MLQVNIIYNGNEVGIKLKRFIQRVSDRKKLLDLIGLSVQKSIKNNFDRQQDSSGQRWIPSIRASMENGRTLDDTGALKDIKYLVNSDRTVKIGTDTPYGIYHQYGRNEPIVAKNAPYLVFNIGKSGPFYAKSTSGYPKREWLYISSEGRNDLLSTVQSFIAEAKR